MAITIKWAKFSTFFPPRWPIFSRCQRRSTRTKHGCFMEFQPFEVSLVYFPVSYQTLYLAKDQMHWLRFQRPCEKVFSFEFMSKVKLFFLNASCKSLFWTCLSEEHPLRGCEHHVIWGFWSGVRREMETHLWGWLSKQCRHDEGHCSVFLGWTTGRPVHRAYPSPFFIASSPVFLSF